MEFFRLNNDVLIPAIGSGTNTFGRDNEDLKSVPTGNFTMMEDAIRNGYRFFDSAISYGNEEGVGTCLKHCGIPREDFFILSKIPNRVPYNVNSESIRKSVTESLDRMQMPYFDLYTIHQAVDYNSPDGKMNVEVTVRLFKELYELYKEGLFRSLGVANFDVEQLKILMDATGIVPACDQIRSNPAQRNLETVEFCKTNNILPMAHSPMNFTTGGFSIDQERKASFLPLATKIGEKYGKGWGQVMLRYNFQTGICSIPKTHFPEFQRQNLDIFDFELTEEEMQALV